MTKKSKKSAPPSKTIKHPDDQVDAKANKEGVAALKEDDSKTPARASKAVDRGHDDEITSDHADAKADKSKDDDSSNTPGKASANPTTKKIPKKRKRSPPVIAKPAVRGSAETKEKVAKLMLQVEELTRAKTALEREIEVKRGQLDLMNRQNRMLLESQNLGQDAAPRMLLDSPHRWSCNIFNSSSIILRKCS